MSTAIPVVDFHTHTPAWDHASWLAGKAFTPADFTAFMDTAGIRAAVVLSHDGLFHATPEANDRLAEFVAADPSRMVAFGTVNPRYPGAAEEMERCFATLGIRGLKIHPWLQGVSMHEPSLDPIAEVVAAHGGIVLCHDGTPPYATATQIAAFARRHPTVPVVLGHAGLHDTWREAIAAVNETANLHICLCGVPPYAGRRIIERCPPDRVLFGSDAGLSDQVGQAYAVARAQEITQWGLDAATLRRVLYDNPRDLLKGWPA
ncbi:MAG TPA: amidohydrolase family protein [Streptosporangiaceae bacterium]